MSIKRWESRMQKRTVYYFEEAGVQNTDRVISAVEERLKLGDIKYVVVASNSGETALKLAKRIKAYDVRVVCVTETPQRLSYGAEWPTITKENKRRLEELGASVIENLPYASHCGVFDNNRWRFPSPNLIVYMTLRTVGGAGLKVAMEVMFIAVWAGVVPQGENVIAVGGTEGGADTAIVVRSAFQENFFASDEKKRPMLREVLAMPIEKKWQDEPF